MSLNVDDRQPTLPILATTSTKKRKHNANGENIFSDSLIKKTFNDDPSLIESMKRQKHKQSLVTQIKRNTGNAPVAALQKQLDAAIYGIMLSKMHAMKDLKLKRDKHLMEYEEDKVKLEQRFVSLLNHIKGVNDKIIAPHQQREIRRSRDIDMVAVIESNISSKTYQSQKFEDSIAKAADEARILQEIAATAKKSKQGEKKWTWNDKIKIRVDYLQHKAANDGKDLETKPMNRFLTEWMKIYFNCGFKDVKRNTIRQWAKAKGQYEDIDTNKGKATKRFHFQSTHFQDILKMVKAEKEVKGDAATEAQIKKAIRVVYEKISSENKKKYIAKTISPSLMRSTYNILLTKLIGTPRADKACRTENRKKAQCIRNLINHIVILYVAQFGPRFNVDAATAKLNPILDGLFGNWDDSTYVIDLQSYVQDKHMCFKLIHDTDNHVYGKSTTGGKLPQRIIMSTLAFADGSIYYMFTVKGRDADNVTKWRKNIFLTSLNLGGGKKCIFRYIRDGVSDAGEPSSSYVQDFIIPSIKKQIKEIAEQQNLDLETMTDLDKAKLLSVVVTHDGAGTILSQIEEYCNAGKADEWFVQFIKRASSSTGIDGIKQPCDKLYRDVKATLRSEQAAYQDEVTGVDDMPGLLLYKLDTKNAAPAVHTFWNNWERHHLVKKLGAMFSGKNATSGIIIQKIKHIQMFFYMFANLHDKLFPMHKVKSAFQHEFPLSPEDDERKKKGETKVGWLDQIKRALDGMGPGYTHLDNRDKDRILHLLTDKESLKDLVDEVIKNGFVTDHYLDNLPLRCIQLEKPVSHIPFTDPEGKGFKVGQKIKILNGFSEFEMFTITKLNCLCSYNYNGIVLDKQITKRYESGYKIYIIDEEDNETEVEGLVDPMAPGGYYEDVQHPDGTSYRKRINRDNKRMSERTMQMLSHESINKQIQEREKNVMEKGMKWLLKIKANGKCKGVRVEKENKQGTLTLKAIAVPELKEVFSLLKIRHPQEDWDVERINDNGKKTTLLKSQLVEKIDEYLPRINRLGNEYRQAAQRLGDD